MVVFRTACSMLLTIALCVNSSARPRTPTPSQASILLQEALSALNGGQTISDVTVSANAQMIAGSDNETGTATLQAVVAGASRVTLSLSGGQRIEIANSSSNPATGSWSGSDGTAHSIAFHNLLTGPFWFIPNFALYASSSSSGAVVTYVGHETHNGLAVEHLSISQTPNYALADALYSHLTQLDFFLDSATFLPAALDFNIHPDNNELQDIPIEIVFSSYTSVNGTQMPAHIQKFTNNVLALDLQIQSTALNTGATLAQIVGN